MTIVVGGVGQLFQGDLDVGRHVAERLASIDLGPRVVVEDFYYGAVAVMQRLRDLEPTGLILVGAERSGAEPGSVRLRRIRPRPIAVWEVQDAVTSAATGYVAIPLVVDVSSAFGVLPERSTAIEVEPAAVDPSDRLTECVLCAVEHACALCRCEVLRIRLEEQAECLERDLRTPEATTLAAAARTLADATDALAERSSRKPLVIT
jgi:Ni,Fe-hydrogenase maturation factor